MGIQYGCQEIGNIPFLTPVEIVTSIYRHIPVLYIIVLILFIVYQQLLNKTISHLDTIFFYYS